MPQNQPYVYDVTIDGQDYEVESPGQLTDQQAYQFALEQHKTRTLAQPKMEAAPSPGFLGGFTEAAGETFRGLKAFGQGMLSDPLDTLSSLALTQKIPETSEEIRAAKLQAAEKQGRQEAGFGERLGRSAEAGAEFLLSMAGGAVIKRGLKGAIAGAGERAAARQEALRAAKGAGALVPEKTPDQPRSSFLPPPADIPSPTAMAAESRARQAAQGTRRGGGGSGGPPAGSPPEPVRHISGPQRVGPTVGEMRGAYGAERTANYMNQMPGLREEIGMPVTREMVQDIAGGPSRVPTTATNAQLDQDFARLIANERGSLSMADAGEILDAVRRESMLSGLALPKSILGNIGSIGAAAIEGSSPFGAAGVLDEALRIPTNTRAFLDAWRNPRTAIQGPGAVGMAGPIARTMGAADAVTQDVLRRAGVPKERILGLSLQNPAGGRWATNWFGPDNSWLRRILAPFTRTAGNVGREGSSELTYLGQHPLTRRSALTLGSMALGGAMGASDTDPMMQIMTAPLMTTRTLPFLLSSAAGSVLAGKAPSGRILSSLTPMPEMTFDPRYWAGWPPSITRYLR